jgi:hypothetical protein
LLFFWAANMSPSLAPAFLVLACVLGPLGIALIGWFFDMLSITRECIVMALNRHDRDNDRR